MDKKQGNKVGIDLDVADNNASSQDYENNENPNKLVLFPSEDDDDLLKMFKKLQADNKNKKTTI